MGGILDWFKSKDTETTSKVFIDGKQSDLSVIKVGAEEYYENVVKGNVASNELYVLSSDFNNMYGQRVSNVGEPVEDEDAATKKYVDDKIQQIREKAATLVKVDPAKTNAMQVAETVNSIIDMLKSI